jgi:hypothetical protein
LGSWEVGKLTYPPSLVDRLLRITPREWLATSLIVAILVNSQVGFENDAIGRFGRRCGRRIGSEGAKRT